MKNKFWKFSLILLALIIPLTLFVAGCDEDEPEEDITPMATIPFRVGENVETIPSLTAEVGSEILAPTNPSKDGYVFEGWLLNGQAFEFDVMPANDITLTANWNKLYTISFDAGVDNLEVESIVKVAGAQIVGPQINRNGYVLEGWLLNGEAFAFDVMPANDITLTANWNKLYTISFDAGVDNLEIESIIQVAGTQIVGPQINRDGYVFEGWLLNGETFVFDVMPANYIILTAKWNKLYTISFDPGVDNLNVESIIQVAGSEITKPEIEHQGYYLKSWKLNGSVYDFDTMPEEDITLSAEWIELTNLPAMLIDLSDSDGNVVELSSITKDAYVKSVISIVNTDEQYELNNIASQFKGRGNGSWEEEKKGYKIKFDKKQSLFGNEANKHWVIIACANFDDITMCRNYLAYSLGRDIFDGIEYTTSTQWIDVYVNGEYRGVYLLCEHVRVDKGRVDISSKYGELDTGYLIEYDAYATGQPELDYFYIEGLNYSFTLHSPDPEEYAEKVTEEQYRAQVAYIKDYVSRVYVAALTQDYATFSELVDIDSFVDMYILHEYCKNTDTGWSSFYLYKKKGGKLYAGPAWDFDGSMNGARGDSSPEGIYVAGSIMEHSDFTASQLFIALYQNENFLQAVKERWQVLSPLIEQFVNEQLNDEMYELNKAAMGKNFVMWKGKTQQQAEEDWVNDVKELKAWLIARINWLNTEWALSE